MAQSRDEIVADFQGITAIDDVAVALYHLEESNWDLLAAVNRVMPQDSHPDVEMVGVIPAPNRAPAPAPLLPLAASPSTSCPAVMEFCVHYDKNDYSIRLPVSATLSDLRSRIAEMSGVPPCRQILDGLGVQHRPGATLASLRLPPTCDVYMTVPEEHKHDESLSARLVQLYTLNVTYEENCYKLRFLGTRTVLQVKEDIYALTDIPVRHQVWTGWPSVPGLDGKSLALVDLSYPEHDFTVRRSASRSAQRDNKKTSESEESDNYEDAVDDDDIVHVDDDLLDTVAKRDEPLIPDNTEDEAVGCFLFAMRFKERYGSSHPLFFQGSLDDAIKESCMKPAKDRRLLGIYLHHESSILSNVFCTQLLIDESVLSILAANFLVYGWDLTFESNKNMLLSSVSNALGTQASMTVKNMPLDKLPVLIIIMRIRSSTEIFSVIDGNVTLEELVGKLMEGVDRWTSRRSEEIQEEQARAARQRVKWEQDEAYRQSLEADRAKEELKRQQEQAENNERRRVENEKQEIEARKKARRQSALSRLPVEPESESGEDITKIRVRLPEGRSLERRFTADTPLRALLDFLTVEGYQSEDYKIISSWPRRDLTTLDYELTFRALNLHPQESVMLEARSHE